MYAVILHTYSHLLPYTIQRPTNKTFFWQQLTNAYCTDNHLMLFQLSSICHSWNHVKWFKGTHIFLEAYTQAPTFHTSTALHHSHRRVLRSFTFLVVCLFAGSVILVRESSEHLGKAPLLSLGESLLLVLGLGQLALCSLVARLQFQHLLEVCDGLVVVLKSFVSLWTSADIYRISVYRAQESSHTTSNVQMQVKSTVLNTYTQATPSFSMLHTKDWKTG